MRNIEHHKANAEDKSKPAHAYELLTDAMPVQVCWSQMD
jgi:hypothetical protein